MATREQRKESRRLAKRVAKRQERHRRQAAQRQAQPADIRRNAHVEKGRAVTLNDIRPYARRGCSRCRRNPGVTNLVKNPAGEITGAEPCKCAHTRFMKAHPEVIVEAGGAAFWPADTKAAPYYQEVKDAGTEIVQRDPSPPDPGETDEEADARAGTSMLGTMGEDE